jgi:hypothetical protein
MQSSASGELGGASASSPIQKASFRPALDCCFGSAVSQVSCKQAVAHGPVSRVLQGRADRATKPVRPGKQGSLYREFDGSWRPGLRSLSCCFQALREGGPHGSLRVRTSGLNAGIECVVLTDLWEESDRRSVKTTKFC